MKYKKFDQMNCSLAQALDIIGERWTLLILRDAFLGARKFGQFQEGLGIARNILSARLKRLVDEGVFEKNYNYRRWPCRISVNQQGATHPTYVRHQPGRPLVITS